MRQRVNWMDRKASLNDVTQRNVMVHFHKSLCTVGFHSMDGVDFRRDLDQILSPAARDQSDSPKIQHLKNSI